MPNISTDSIKQGILAILGSRNCQIIHGLMNWNRLNGKCDEVKEKGHSFGPSKAVLTPTDSSVSMSFLEDDLILCEERKKQFKN